ncbi:hypothetical protein CBA19CS91_32505 [Paraburkholderia hospita]|nr:hypothetical protein CBA19CS91_32505 [Paraburkholderia hospita]
MKSRLVKSPFFLDAEVSGFGTYVVIPANSHVQMDRTYHGHRPRNRRSMCDPADPQNNNTNATGKAYER